MVPAILIAAGIGFSALLVPDLCRLARYHRLAVASSVVGFASVLLALVLEVTSFRAAGPLLLRVAFTVLSGVFAVLLVYSAVIEIPLHCRCSAAGRTVTLYTAGTYRLSRHPGMLWFLLMQASLNVVFLDATFVLVSAALVLGDLILVFVQDRYLFPLLLPDYRNYQLRVPFLFPRIHAGRHDKAWATRF
jgi:protein-S-isoprenylcysteine O-methyltransferase Ste14